MVDMALHMDFQSESLACIDTSQVTVSTSMVMFNPRNVMTLFAMKVCLQEMVQRGTLAIHRPRLTVCTSWLIHAKHFQVGDKTFKLVYFNFVNLHRGIQSSPIYTRSQKYIDIAYNFCTIPSKYTAYSLIARASYLR